MEPSNKKIKLISNHGTLGTLKHPFPVEAIHLLENELQNQPHRTRIAAVTGIIGACSEIPKMTRAQGCIFLHLYTSTPTYYSQSSNKATVPKVLIILREDHLGSLFGDRISSLREAVSDSSLQIDQVLTLTHLRLKRLSIKDDQCWMAWTSTTQTRFLKIQEKLPKFSLPLERPMGTLYSSESLSQKLGQRLSKRDSRSLSYDSASNLIQSAYPPHSVNSNQYAIPEMVSYQGTVTKVVSKKLGLYVVDNIHLLLMHYTVSSSDSKFNTCEQKFTGYNMHCVILDSDTNFPSIWKQEVPFEPDGSIICLVPCMYSKIEWETLEPSSPSLLQLNSHLNEIETNAFSFLSGFSDLYLPLQWLFAFVTLATSLAAKFPDYKFSINEIMLFLQPDIPSLWPRRHRAFEFCEHPDFCSCTNTIYPSDENPSSQPHSSSTTIFPPVPIRISRLDEIGVLSSSIAIIGEVETSYPNYVWLTDGSARFRLVCPSVSLSLLHQIVLVHGARVYKHMNGTETILFAKELIPLASSKMESIPITSGWLMQVESIREVDTQTSCVEGNGKLLGTNINALSNVISHLDINSIRNSSFDVSIETRQLSYYVPLLTYGGIYLVFSSKDERQDNHVILHEINHVVPCFAEVAASTPSILAAKTLQFQLNKRDIPRPFSLQKGTLVSTLLDGKISSNKLVHLTTRVIQTTWKMGEPNPTLTVQDTWDQLNCINITLPARYLPAPVLKGTFTYEPNHETSFLVLGNEVTFYNLIYEENQLRSTSYTRVQWSSKSLPLDHPTWTISQWNVLRLKWCDFAYKTSTSFLTHLPIQSIACVVARIASVSRIQLCLICPMCERTVSNASCSCLDSSEHDLSILSNRSLSPSCPRTRWEPRVHATMTIHDVSGSGRLLCQNWTALKILLDISSSQIHSIEQILPSGKVTLYPKIQELNLSLPVSSVDAMSMELLVSPSRMVRIALSRLRMEKIQSGSAECEFQLHGAEPVAPVAQAWDFLLQSITKEINK